MKNTTCEEYRKTRNIDSLSSLIRDVLEVTGLNSRELADRLNVGNSTISDWKHGKFPRFRTQEAVSETLKRMEPYGEIWSEIFDRLSEDNNMRKSSCSVHAGVDADVGVDIDSRVLKLDKDRHVMNWTIFSSTDPEFDEKAEAMAAYFHNQLRYVEALGTSRFCGNLV